MGFKNFKVLIETLNKSLIIVPIWDCLGANPTWTKSGHSGPCFYNDHSQEDPVEGTIILLSDNMELLVQRQEQLNRPDSVPQQKEFEAIFVHEECTCKLMAETIEAKLRSAFEDFKQEIQTDIITRFAEMNETLRTSNSSLTATNQGQEPGVESIILIDGQYPVNQWAIKWDIIHSRDVETFYRKLMLKAFESDELFNKSVTGKGKRPGVNLKKFAAVLDYALNEWNRYHLSVKALDKVLSNTEKFETKRKMRGKLNTLLSNFTASERKRRLQQDIGLIGDDNFRE